jgi:hypothetical protein
VLVSLLRSLNIYPPLLHFILTHLSLHQGQSERDLQSAVQAVFSAYGKVYVKIRRDPAGMPYAFCQFLVRIPTLQVSSRIKADQLP